MSTKDIILTIDVDWAPEEMIEDTLLVLEEYKVKATFFCTHKSPLLLNQKEHELGIHPNFIPLIEGNSKKTKEQIVDELLDIYPDAKGVRAHGLVQSSGIMQLYIDKGLKYDSNILLPYQQIDKYVYDEFKNFKRNVYNWSDDVHMLYKVDDFSKICINESGKNIIAFHPFHIFANTQTMAKYSELKKYYTDAAMIKKHRVLNEFGVRSYFLEVLKIIKDKGLSTPLLNEKLK